jgi:hypothetical protein
LNRRLISCVVIVSVIVTFTVVLIPAVLPTKPSSETLEFTVEDKSIEFLSRVIGLDFTEYALITPTPPPSFDAESWAEIGAKSEAQRRERLYPPEYCGLVKSEWGSFKFEANGSSFSVMSNCLNEQLILLEISDLNGNYLYSEAPATGLLNQAKAILQRYHTYANQMYTTDNSYLEPMQNILNTVNDLSPTNITTGNINFQVSKDGDRTLIKWIYSEGGVSMKWKRLDLTFNNNAFESMIDNWRIYNVSGPSEINSEEAYKLALDTAQNCEFRIVNEYRNETVMLPDLSGSVYQMYFTMVPYRNETSLYPSKINRDPLTLYPYWQFYFYFKGGTIGGYSGVQVGIWGDTKEIVYCNGFGFYDASFPSD